MPLPMCPSPPLLMFLKQVAKLILDLDPVILLLLLLVPRNQHEVSQVPEKHALPQTA